MQLNVVHAYQTLSAATQLSVNCPEIEANPGQLVWCTVQAHSLTGAPTLASLAVKWQVAPLAVQGGYNIASETSAIQRAWVDVSPGGLNGLTLLHNAEGWPTTMITAALTTNVFCTRKMYAPPLQSFVRINLTASFAGGTAPSVLYTVSMFAE